MDDDWDDLLLTLDCGILMVGLELAQKQKHRKNRYWVSPYLRERNQKGRFMTDFDNLRRAPNLFIENFLMFPEIFDELFELLEPCLLAKVNTRPNDFIPAKAKLAIVLEYMASGDLQRHLASCYRISKQHFGTIVSHVCGAICETLKTEVPEWTKETLSDISDEFQLQWNFPNCVGVIDGKHIHIKAPAKSGRIFYNYKGFHSIVLMATCDANYRFTYLDIGGYGSEGDANIIKNSKFTMNIVNDTCQLPPDTLIDDKKVPYFIVADDAFPLCKRILKPFTTKPLSTEEKIFNYRLSRATRCIDNTFGILSAKWLCLRKVLFCSPDRAQQITSACCLLHNFLLRKSCQTYTSRVFAEFEDGRGNWVTGECEANVEQGPSPHPNELNPYRGRTSDYSKYVRNVLKDYVNSANGSVPWQNNAAFL